MLKIIKMTLKSIPKKLETIFLLNILLQILVQSSVEDMEIKLIPKKLNSSIK